MGQKSSVKGIIRNSQKAQKWRITAAALSGTVFAVLLTIVLILARTPGALQQMGQDEVTAGSVSEDPQELVLSLGNETDEMILSWKGDAAGPGVFRWADSESGLASAEWIHAKRASLQKGTYYRYSIRLKHLKPGETYWYQLGDGIEFQTAKCFRSPEPSRKVKLLFFADPQFRRSAGEYERWGKLTEQALRQTPDADLGIIGGDLVNSAADLQQWDGFLKRCGVFQKLPVITVPGNHEGVRSNRTYHKMLPDSDLTSNLPPGFRSLDYGCCRIILLDSSFLEEGRRQKMGRQNWERSERAIETWLTDTLRQSRKAWTIAVIHHPPYGMHDRKTVSPRIRQQWTPIMEQYGTDLVLSGHQHMYLRTAKINGILYVMGNSGGMHSSYYNGYNEPLYAECVYGKQSNYQTIEADDTELRLISRNQKGSIIDETSLSKKRRSRIAEFLRLPVR